jgi:hypothetical protein
VSASLPLPRSVFDRRSGHDRRNLSPQEKIALAVCREAGVVFVGLQSGFEGVPTQIIFQRDTGTTGLCIPAAGATSERIHQRLVGHQVQQYRALAEFWFPTKPQRAKVDESTFATNRVAG